MRAIPIPASDVSGEDAERIQAIERQTAAAARPGPEIARITPKVEYDISPAQRITEDEPVNIRQRDIPRDVDPGDVGMRPGKSLASSRQFHEEQEMMQGRIRHGGRTGETRTGQTGEVNLWMT